MALQGWSHWLSFNNATILTYAPKASGVYDIADAFGTIYYGKAEGGSVRDRLLDHLRTNPALARRAFAFRYMICPNPGETEKLLLALHQFTKGRLPTFNHRIG